MRMKLKIKFADAYCTTKTFKINEIDADYEDFGYIKKIFNMDWLTCADQSFIINNPTHETLNKYNINIRQYNIIAKKLKEGLTFGPCGLCE